MVFFSFCDSASMSLMPRVLCGASKQRAQVKTELKLDGMEGSSTGPSYLGHVKQSLMLFGLAKALPLQQQLMT